jgi:CheY-like chemotaxis protein
VPDALLCDYRLRGGLNGLETIQGLRLAMRTQVPACLISGDTDPEIVKAAQLTGLTLLHKPVRIDALRSVLISLTREPVKPNGTAD